MISRDKLVVEANVEAEAESVLVMGVVGSYNSKEQVVVGRILEMEVVVNLVEAVVGNVHMEVMEMVGVV